MHHRGVSTAIGALLFLMIAFSMLGLYMVMYNLNFEIASEYLNKMEKEHRYPKLNYTINYTKIQQVNPIIGDYIKYDVLSGVGSDDGEDSLAEVDNKNITVKSSIIQGSSSMGKTYNLISNGDFSNDFIDWTYNSYIGEWSIDTRSNNKYARYTGSLNLNKRINEISIAYLSQEFNYSSGYTNPVFYLKYKYEIDSVSNSFYYNVTVSCVIEIKDHNDLVIWKKNITLYEIWFNGHRSESIPWSNIYFPISSLNEGTYTLNISIHALLVDIWPHWESVNLKIMFGFDDIYLNVSFPGGGSGNAFSNFAEIEFDLPGQTFSYFYFIANTTTFAEVYYFNSNSNIWVLDKKYIMEDDYVNVSVPYSRVRFLFYSYNPFRIDFDYLRIDQRVFADKINISLFNYGDGEERIISVWINDTRYPNTGVLNIYILPGEKRVITIDLSSLNLSLEKNKVYIVQVVGTRAKYIEYIDT